MARYITLIAFISLFSLISGQCNIKRAQNYFRRSVYDFNLQLVSRIGQETENHFIASGLSAWTLLSVISLGATEDTLTEIMTVLKMHPHTCFNNKFFEITRQLTSVAEGALLERSAAMFIDKRLNVTAEFQIDVRKSGVCSVEVLPFDDFSTTASYINEFVSLSTHEAIDEIVNPSDIEDAYIIMIDALYFKGTWKLPFPYEDTEASAFYNEQNVQIGDVNLMYVTGKFNLTAIKPIQARVLELPYGEPNRYSMLIFLPFRDVSLARVIDNLRYISLRTIFHSYEKFGGDSVSVQIPRFKVTSDINNLKELLIDMGLRKMFDISEASFQDLAAYEVYVSNFIQKADIEVTEDGTVASAVSEAIFESRMMPDQFVANKPFLFMIVDKFTEIPLFTGAYSKPTIF